MMRRENQSGEYKKTKRKHFEISPLVIVLLAILLLYSISLFIPFLWSLNTSVKSWMDFETNKFWLPEGKIWEWEYDNYIYVFKMFKEKVKYSGGYRLVYLPEMFFNSVLYALGCALVQSFTICIVAYVTSKFSHFTLAKIIYNTVIVVMILPIIGSTPSEIRMAQMLGIYDTIWGMWIMKMNFLGMYYLVFHAMYKGIPKDYADSAYIDGANEFQVMTKIMLPLARNTLLTVILINFIAYWNDYQTPLLYIPNHPTMAYGLYLLSRSTNAELSQVPRQVAGCMMVLVPILIVFLIFKNRLIVNVSMGGLKE